ncbi:uncharacterized protein LOC133173851 [Saccostrea echinata]|uniref:uncharacterized protein LOC133173851 n=1 Tax=Saccostrea echinata TaxID=191078 RepID=UPI002A8389CC|nr:uncharacterized protein LOC133173851 [Saccostrea echinata]
MKMHFVHLKIYICIHVHIFLNLKLLTSSQFCGTRIGGLDYCCDNYYYDRVKNDCIECPFGSYGQNCSKACTKPKFGWLCYYTCDCDIDECDIIKGCLNESEFSTLLPASTTFTRMYESPVSKQDLKTPYGQATETFQNTRAFKNTESNAGNLVIVLTISIASGVIVIWIVVFAIFCCITRKKVSFFNQKTEGSGPDSNEVVETSLRNQETDIYMEIEENPDILGEENINIEDESTTRTSYDQLSKSVSDSSRYNEIGKYYTDIEKYKTFTTHKALQNQVKLKRHFSWHHALDTSSMSSSPKKANSYIDICEDDTYLQAVYALKDIVECRKFIYANMSSCHTLHFNLNSNIDRTRTKIAESYDDFIAILN